MDALNLLVVEPARDLRTAYGEVAHGLGFAFHAADTGEAARRLASAFPVDLILLEWRVPGGGLGLLKSLKALRPEADIILTTSASSVRHAVEAVRCGAADVMAKPFALDDLRVCLERARAQHQSSAQDSAAVRRIRERLSTARGFGALIGESPEMAKLYRLLSRVATGTNPVLISGESGSGRELVARTVHLASAAAAQPFICIDCTAVAVDATERDLFPELAGGSVLFDEIAELPLEVQARLMRALQEKSLPSRLLASSSRDLEATVAQGNFRRDLYFSLNVVKINVPPLRQRKEDVPLLVAHFLEQEFARSQQRHELSAEFLKWIMEYDWPGNVRELESCVQRACLQADGPLIDAIAMPTQLRNARDLAIALRQSGSAEDATFGILPLAAVERQTILNALEKVAGDKLLAAKLLGIGKTTLYRKLKEYDALSSAGILPH